MTYVDKKFCIYADAIASKRASDARTKRDFQVDITPVSQLLSLSSTAYIKEEDITDIFHPDVISTSTVKQTFDQVSNHLDTIVYDTLGVALSGSTTTILVNGIAEQLQAFKKQLQTKSSELSRSHS